MGDPLPLHFKAPNTSSRIPLELLMSRLMLMIATMLMLISILKASPPCRHLKSNPLGFTDVNIDTDDEDDIEADDEDDIDADACADVDAGVSLPLHFKTPCNAGANSHLLDFEFGKYLTGWEWHLFKI